MSRIDAALSKLPGTPATKAIGASIFLVAAFSYPVFYISKETRQGHDYLSSERPEAIMAGQERLRRDNRKKRALSATASDESNPKQE